MSVNASPISELATGVLTPLAPEDRLAHLLEMLNDAPPNIFWPLFLEWFPVCTDIWPHQRRLRLMLRSAGAAYEYQSEREKALLNGLDAEQQVFRGCYTSRRKGLSWSLDYERADAFARWHRAIAGSGDVYETMIPRRDILAAVTARNETFVLLDYTCLSDVQRIVSKPPASLDKTFGPVERDRIASTRPVRTDFDQFMRGTRNNKLPPIENMTNENLAAMLAQKLNQLRTVQLLLQRTALEADIRRARREIADRKRGALPGRKVEKQTKQPSHDWEQKKRAGGRPTNASKIVTLPVRARPPAFNDDLITLLKNKAA